MGNDQDVVDRDLTQEDEETEPSFFASPKRLLQTAFVVLLLLAAIYILVPKILGTKGAIGQLGDVALGVDRVFVAAERDDGDLHAVGRDAGSGKRANGVLELAS